MEGIGVSVPSLFGNPLRKTVTFSNTTGTVSLFTVTGDVIIRILATCGTDVASAAAANIELGVTGDTDALIASTLSTDLAAREVWSDASPNSEIEALDSALLDYFVTDGNDVILTLSDQVDSGVLEFVCWWIPVSTTGVVVAA